MKVNSLKQLYVEELKDAYDAENQIVKALPKLIKATSTPQLREALEDHLQQTRGHVQRLEQIFESLGEPAKAKKCDGLRGILEEGEKTISDGEQGPVLDAGLIAGAQRVEHYEMAAYGSLKTWARQLGDNQAVRLLEQTLNEEKEADRKLTEIATSSVNAEASKAMGANA
ncbi:MAG: ferritin-like domain-containing protein [Terriglobia bacterium]|jgi:ferritin-like metal-binding protein YciE